jgi:uncharacterized protein YdaU (DUF1376 family)
MHYYNFHIGDYASHTRHLTIIEDIAYRRILDFYYLHEQPIISDKIARQIGMKEYQEDVSVVLQEFFESTDQGYINRRADEEIAQYREFIEAGRRGAAKRWGKAPESGDVKGEDSPPIAPPIKEGNEGVIPTTPIPTTHKPSKRDSYESLPSNFQSSEYRDESIRFAEWWSKELKPGTIKDNMTNRVKWAHTWFHLRETDGRANGAEMCEAIAWARSEPFWSTNFLSPMKLRDKDKNGIMYIDRFLEQYRKQKDGRTRDGQQQRGLTADKLGRLADHINSSHKAPVCT